MFRQFCLKAIYFDMNYALTANLKVNSTPIVYILAMHESNSASLPKVPLHCMPSSIQLNPTQSNSVQLNPTQFSSIELSSARSAHSPLFQFYYLHNEVATPPLGSSITSANESESDSTKILIALE